ncbi:hypothetical protein ACXC9Q_18755 [Kribbella sp. CWNU-51]
MTFPIHDPFWPPLVGADTWSRVLGEAGWRCECTGDCGRPHTKSEHRCPVDHGLKHRLSVVPSDPTVTLTKAVTGAELVAMCPACATGAKRLAEAASDEATNPTTDQLGLFDLTGGDAA